MVTKMHFLISFCQVSENIHTHHKEFHLSQEGGVSYQSKLLGKGCGCHGGGGGVGLDILVEMFCLTTVH